jgi:hypothetical protein
MGSAPSSAGAERREVFAQLLGWQQVAVGAEHRRPRCAASTGHMAGPWVDECLLAGEPLVGASIEHGPPAAACAAASSAVARRWAGHGCAVNTAGAGAGSGPVATG